MRSSLQKGSPGKDWAHYRSRNPQIAAKRRKLQMAKTRVRKYLREEVLFKLDLSLFAAQASTFVWRWEADQGAEGLLSSAVILMAHFFAIR